MMYFYHVYLLSKRGKAKCHCQNNIITHVNIRYNLKWMINILFDLTGLYKHVSNYRAHT